MPLSLSQRSQSPPSLRARAVITASNPGRPSASIINNVRRLMGALDRFWPSATPGTASPATARTLLLLLPTVRADFGTQTCTTAFATRFIGRVEVEVFGRSWL